MKNLEEFFNKANIFKNNAKEGVVFIGGGGGSDVIQAAQLALLSRQRAAIVSIRTAKTGSLGKNGKQDEQRSIENHGGEIFPNVFIVTPQSTGSGRFLESIPATELPTYLIIDSNDDQLTQQLEAVLAHVPSVIQTEVAQAVLVDTGGDILYRNSFANSARATPDQDLRSLHAVNKLKYVKKSTMIVAPGIDSPEYFEDILADAHAISYSLNNDETAQVQNTYERYDFTGKNEARYGKTPFTWQAALRGEFGETILPLPRSLIEHPTNPWNPIVNINPRMANVEIIEYTDDHLEALIPTEVREELFFDTLPLWDNINGEEVITLSGATEISQAALAALVIFEAYNSFLVF
jgi:hypothetical protein